MKRHLSFILLCFLSSPLSTNTLFAQTVSQPNMHGLDPWSPIVAYDGSRSDVMGIDHNVFIGQAYPSGNVYLECFREKRDCRSLWPKVLLILPLVDTGPALGKAEMKSSFVKVMKDGLNGNVIQSAYIPGVEGMDDNDHGSCGLGKSKRVDKYKYISDTSDYFHAMSDYCNPNEGIGVYRTAASSYSFLVLGIDPRITIADVKLLSGNRPLTTADQQEIASMKEEQKKNDDDCTTDPIYIDSATQIAEISLSEGDLRLRVSTYQTAGCSGHWARFYILDVMQRDLVLRKFEIYRTEGVL
jgi:hypothetical protein